MKGICKMGVDVFLEYGVFQSERPYCMNEHVTILNNVSKLSTSNGSGT